MTKNALSTYWSSSLSTVGSTSSTCLQRVHLSLSKKTVLFASKGGPTFSRGGWGRTQLLSPIELVIFKVSPGHLHPPPHTHTSSLGPCITDPSQNYRVSCLNHELC